MMMLHRAQAHWPQKNLDIPIGHLYATKKNDQIFYIIKIAIKKYF